MKPERFNSIALVAVILFLFAELALLFFTPRNETVQLLTVYFAMCGAYLVLYQEVRSIRNAAFLGVLFRVVAWFTFPTLSDDIYRFIWDGAMILEGNNPYLQTPTAFLEGNLHAPFDQLYPLLNSTNYYSVYPPVMQVISAFGALASNDLYLSSLVIKLPLLIAEIATIWMLPKLLLDLNFSPKYSVLYMLNPLLIVDVLGNAHFEALSIFLIVWTIRLIKDGYSIGAGGVLALAFGTKLIPIILLPFLFKSISGKMRWAFLGTFIAISSVLFYPLLSPNAIENFGSSIQLYLDRFEFNGSIYYVLSAIGEWLFGYNPIRWLGPTLTGLAMIWVLFQWIRMEKHSLLDATRKSLWAILGYYLLSTTVHPWYVSTLVLLGIMSRRPFAVIWSVVVFVSYSAYETSIYEENPILITLEYLILLIAIMYPKFLRKVIVSPINRL